MCHLLHAIFLANLGKHFFRRLILATHGLGVTYAQILNLSYRQRLFSVCVRQFLLSHLGTQCSIGTRFSD